MVLKSQFLLYYPMTINYEDKGETSQSPVRSQVGTSWDSEDPAVDGRCRIFACAEKEGISISPPVAGCTFSSSFAPGTALFYYTSSFISQFSFLCDTQCPWMRKHRPRVLCSTQENPDCLRHRESNMLLPVSALRFWRTVPVGLLLTSHDPSRSSEPKTWGLCGKFTSASMSFPGFNSWSLLLTAPLFPGAWSRVGIKGSNQSCWEESGWSCEGRSCSLSDVAWPRGSAGTPEILERQRPHSSHLIFTPHEFLKAIRWKSLCSRWG